MDRSLEVTSVEPTFSPVACPITQVLKDSGETSFCAEGPHRSASLYLKTPRLGPAYSVSCSLQPHGLYPARLL